MAEKNEEKRAVANEKQQKNVVLSTASKFNININIIITVIVIIIVVELHCHAISTFVYVCVFVLSSDPAPNSHRQHFPAFTISLIGCIFFRSLLHFHISLLTILFLFLCPSLSPTLPICLLSSFLSATAFSTLHINMEVKCGASI